ncbi:MAG: hypothetical protein CMJ78_24530 [Planctomycetaceae bacterium]|nr:hypothetical protein [Planctomycetaceae bacterium]
MSVRFGGLVKFRRSDRHQDVSLASETTSRKVRANAIRARVPAFYKSSFPIRFPARFFDFVVSQTKRP